MLLAASKKLYQGAVGSVRTLSSITQSGRKLDALQEQAMKEQCILIDNNDKAIGSASKRDCHTVDPETGNVMLHRAFSVFLFNTKGEFLLQRRSMKKITFPGLYSNTCCSHPLYEIENEREEHNAMGVRRAAQRRLNYELGIPCDQVEPENFNYLTRIHYKDKGDGTWGEHEIDYLLFLQKDVDLNPNANEVSELIYIKRSEFDETISKLDAPLTPWFKLIKDYQLNLWWHNLHKLKEFVNHKQIHRLN